MQTAEKKQADWAVLWQEERQTLSLQGEPVLEYALVRPQIRDGGAGRTAAGPVLSASGGGLAPPVEPRALLACLSGPGPLPGAVPSIPSLAGPPGGPGPVSGPGQPEYPPGCGGRSTETAARSGYGWGCLVPAGGSPAAGRSLLPRRPAVVAPPDPEAAGTG